MNWSVNNSPKKYYGPALSGKSMLKPEFSVETKLCTLQLFSVQLSPLPHQQ